MLVYDAESDQGEGIPCFLLILPLCDTYNSGVHGDKQLSYYFDVYSCSNLYTYQIGIGGSYGHAFNNIKISYLLYLDGNIVRYCVKEGTNIAI